MSSGVRARHAIHDADAPHSAAMNARSRVIAYLRAHGLTDRVRLNELVDEVLSECARSHGPASSQGSISACVGVAQRRVRRFLGELFPERSESIHPLWLHGFAQAHPDCFLGDIEAARAAAARFGDPWSGRLPVTRSFAAQPLPLTRLPRWLAGLWLPLLLSGGLAGILLHALTGNGLTTPELAWSVLFGCVVFTPAMALGVALRGWRPRPARADPAVLRASPAALPRCALLMPIHHEDPERVFAAVAAMAEDLSAQQGGSRFELFVLSDSHDPLCVADEARAFRRVAAFARQRGWLPVYYRRRASNEHRKPGNLADFFERFGHDYAYAVVLDADSLMTGAALVELARRIHADPTVALVQAPLQLFGGRSLLARCQQLLASVCGPLFMRGLARWSGPHGNYYGHNAIVRVDAFMQCCALPLLPGRPPLGGAFLSHDFVEAALLCRAGWKVQAAWDLSGSWEQMPHTLSEYIARERRWCQGNLQHLRLVLAEGLPSMSRLHLLFGALSYLNAPLLLAFLAMGVWVAGQDYAAGASSPVAWLLVGTAIAGLLLPRLLGAVETLTDPERRRQHGGGLPLLTSLLLEGVISLWLAPVLLFHHSRAVLSVVFGRSVEWGKLPGGRRTSFRRRARTSELPTMLFGALIAASTWAVDPRIALWLSLQWLPMLLAAPISRLCSGTALARFVTRLSLFTTPVDLAPPRVMVRAHELRCLTAPDQAARFRDIVLDPILLAAHIDRLETPRQGPAAPLRRARARAVRLGPAGLTDTERNLLQRDADSLRRLHQHAWRRWPIEAWSLGDELRTPSVGTARPPAL